MTVGGGPIDGMDLKLSDLMIIDMNMKQKVR
jgi:hypothetical protein